ncbi:MAG: HAD family hydrolase [Candidatus Pacebacteria bacterium]|nr:HAD family hydrolase [Candidatus Paceibacterota bacterium]
MKLRPHLIEFLEYVSNSYEIIVFCNGSTIYCSHVLDFIERQRRYFAHRLYNNHVLLENSTFSVKFYDVLLNEQRTLHNTVIVESQVATYSLLIYSGVPMLPYKAAEAGDRELVRLASFLDQMLKVDSVFGYISGKVRHAMF